MKQQATFNFTDSVELNIAGNVFTLTPTPEMTAQAKIFADRAGKMHKQALAGKVKDSEVVDMCKEVITSILGAGSFETIFTDREPNLKDCYNLTIFIFAEIKSFYR